MRSNDSVSDGDSDTQGAGGGTSRSKSDWFFSVALEEARDSKNSIPSMMARLQERRADRSCVRCVHL
jgi:hypothetical protein